MPFVVVTRIPETSEGWTRLRQAQSTTVRRRSNRARSTGLRSRRSGAAAASLLKGRHIGTSRVVDFVILPLYRARFQRFDKLVAGEPRLRLIVSAIR
jgi:hypothetical protein